MRESSGDTVVFVKRGRTRHAHHGGAWKVAYADFVTALMSLFIVLWLTSSSETVKRSVAEYFQDPLGTSTMQGTNRNGAAQALPLGKDQMQLLKEKLMEAAQQAPNFEQLKKQIEITAEQDGLRIELLEQPGGTFFESGSAQPTPALSEFLQAISPELGKLGNRISIEGHTDSVPYNEKSGYTNWELSADRANAARRLMQAEGVGPRQVAEVRGFADQLPRRPDAPSDPSNRRITLIVQPGSVVTPDVSAAGTPTKVSQQANAAKVVSK